MVIRIVTKIELIGAALRASVLFTWQFFLDRIMNGLPHPDSDADRHQNVIIWSLGHTPALHKILSKSVGNNPVNADFGIRNGLQDPGGDPDRHQN